MELLSNFSNDKNCINIIHSDNLFSAEFYINDSKIVTGICGLNNILKENKTSYIKYNGLLLNDINRQILITKLKELCKNI